MIMIMSSLKVLSRLTRHSSDQDVLIPKCRTKLFQFSYCNHAKLWNTLPESTCALTFLNQFISHFLQRYSSLDFAAEHDAILTLFHTAHNSKPSGCSSLELLTKKFEPCHMTVSRLI